MNPIDISEKRSNANLRKVSVSSFKGKKFVNIRQYYVDSSTKEHKPGKNGITLSIEELDNLYKVLDILKEEYNKSFCPQRGQNDDGNTSEAGISS
jgi:hypothetical protein